MLQTLLRAIKGVPPIDTEEDTLKLRRAYSYADKASQDMLVQLNKELYKQAQDEAKTRGMSLSSYVRESLIYRLSKVTPEKEAEIDQLLGECTSQEDKTLIIEGEKGFLNQIVERGLTGEVWTLSQIDKVALRLRISPRSTENQCVQAMKLDKMQSQYFTTQLEYIRSTQPKEEETGVAPFAICDRDECHKPLTEDQYNSPNCLYCNGTKGTRFVYDKKSPAQPKPYAMCAKCHRPLPKEAKTWKQCKHCGTSEPEIVVNYEGIQRQTPSTTPPLPPEKAKEILETIAKAEYSEKEETEES